MTQRHRSVRPSLRAAALAVSLLVPALLAAGASPARAADPPTLPGYVDGKGFASLATEQSELVQISIGGQLLKAIAGSFAQEDPGLAKLLGQIESVQAVVVGFGGDGERAARAEKLVGEMRERLGRDGWETLAQIQDKGSRVTVQVRSGEIGVNGLVVLVLDRNQGKVVFANLAGLIDLAKIAAVGKGLKVPGLDQVPAPPTDEAPPPAPAPAPPAAPPAGR